MGLLDKGSKRKLDKTIVGKVITIVTIILALYLVYSSVWSFPFAIMYRGIFLSVLVAIVVISYTLPGEGPNKIRIMDYILAALSLLIGLYMVLQTERLVFRTPFFDEVFMMDVIAGVIMVLLVLEATRRTVGWPLTIISGVMLTYPFVGMFIPGLFGHRGFKLYHVVEQIFMTTNGIFGEAIGIASTYVFMFVLFGVFLKSTGGGDFFFDLSISVAGHTRGGLAKTAVLASALFGSISGSPISNVATTGAFTIPMMKRSGYPAYFAGAVETAASCGGTIMPPVMGAVAFVMAEVVGVPYYQVLAAAIIPAVLYYGAVFYAVDTEAIKQNLKGMDKSELPPVGKTLLGGIQYLFPLVWLVARLFQGLSPARVAIEAVVVMIVIGLLVRNPKYPITLNVVFEALEGSIKTLLPVAIACGAAGVVVGVITLTGAGGKFTSLILSMAQGFLFPALILTMIVTIILGMGMSITPTYILAASLAAPALVKAGVPVMAAHLFIVYYAAMATMTPPVSLSAYTAAGIADSDPMKVGFAAVRIGIVAFVIPYVFVYQPQLIIHNNIGQSIVTTLLVALGCYALTAGVNRWLLKELKLWEAVLVITSSALLFTPNIVLQIVGIAVFLVFIVRQRIKARSSTYSQESERNLNQ